MKFGLRFYSPDAAAGGGAPAAPIASAPVEPAVPAAQPSAPSAAPASGQGTPPPPLPSDGDPGAAAPSVAPDAVSMPGEPGSDEWNQCFLELSYEDRLRVEQGNYVPSAPVAAAAAPAANPDAAPLPGDKPGDPAAASAEPQVGWSQEEFEKLDPKSKATAEFLFGEVDRLQAQLEQSPANEQTLELLRKDPYIAKRMEQLAAGEDPLAIPAALKVPFNPSSVITSELLREIGLDASDTEAVSRLGDMIGAAFNAGAQRAGQLASYQQTQAVEQVKLETKVTSELNDLVKGLAESSPEFKGAVESKLDIRDAKHPIQAFIAWSGENLDNSFFQKHSMKVAYAAYLEATGGLSKAMQNVAKNTRERMIRQMEKAQEQVRSMGAEAQRPAAADVNAAGIDQSRYLSDGAYAQSVYESARRRGDFQQMRKLEVLATTGKWPD